MLSRSEVISEGQRNVRNGRDAYFGSTMLTIDLPSLELLLRDACDALGLARVAGAKPKAVRTHVTIRAQASRVFIDIDVEATF